jgi:hypothetical protein
LLPCPAKLILRRDKEKLHPLKFDAASYFVSRLNNYKRNRKTAKVIRHETTKAIRRSTNPRSCFRERQRPQRQQNQTELNSKIASKFTILISNSEVYGHAMHRIARESGHSRPRRERCSLWRAF